ncbi:hypothetical protein J7L48_04320 [bacterium]|nr:hypothetical protein [bacterium]
MNPRFWELIIDITPGVKNVFLHLMKVERIYLPYIPVPGIRQIIYFFKNDEVLKKAFQKDLINPYKNIDKLKNAYILLNYSGDLRALKNLKVLPKDYILNKAIENINDFGLISLRLKKYIKKYKSYSTFNIKKLFTQINSLKGNEETIKKIWDEI